ncbi:MAG: exodeoxyribonuclease III [Rhodocyclaceae bacterium]|nr:exodeoxyribonuclease III [Rhodocyclaceae bacterium]MBX3667131.1 exodeoxyribonuclease III [Rhodocyclaceae bacterium]
MRIATWNVNSLKIRLPHLLEWLASEQPDAVCLQETKTEDAAFPRADIEAAGYRVVFSGQKTYNGVAVLTRAEPAEVRAGIPGYEDAQKRVLAATVDGVRLVCAYFPNGQEVGSDKYAYKLEWLEALIAWLGAEVAHYPRLALLGDYNIAPEDADVHDPALWAGKVLCSEPERAAFRRLLELGFRDSFRLFEQQPKSYTWWDYRMLGFQKNHGMRIDHILLTPELAARCTGCRVDRAMRKRERPSDHAPVIAELAP